MIDDRINQSLKDLESQLQSVQSAKEQVNSVVNSFNNYNAATSKYLATLQGIETRLSNIVELFLKDYKLKISEMEKDRTLITKSCNNTIAKVNDTAESIRADFSESIRFLKMKLWFSIGLNIIVVIMLITMHLMK